MDISTTNEDDAICEYLYNHIYEGDVVVICKCNGKFYHSIFPGMRAGSVLCIKVGTTDGSIIIKNGSPGI